jgi:hypothetical protein
VTPEEKYFAHSRNAKIPLKEELAWWTQQIVLGKRTSRMEIAAGDLEEGIVFDCMKVLELFQQEAMNATDDSSNPA